MSVEIKQHQPGKDLEDFIQVAFEVFGDDPAWVPPLHMEITDRLTPEKNPFFEHAEVALFTAWKDGKAVGRISAQIDHEHLRIHKDNVGFFGFFDTLQLAAFCDTPNQGHSPQIEVPRVEVFRRFGLCPVPFRFLQFL